MCTLVLAIKKEIYNPLFPSLWSERFECGNNESPSIEVFPFVTHSPPLYHLLAPSVYGRNNPLPVGDEEMAHGTRLVAAIMFSKIRITDTSGKHPSLERGITSPRLNRDHEICPRLAQHVPVYNYWSLTDRLI